jgi:hypothetical protein
MSDHDGVEQVFTMAWRAQARTYDDVSREFKPVSLAEMFDEVFGKLVDAPKGIRGAMYDAAYFESSQHVHSNVASLDSFVRLGDRYFKIANPENRKESVEAIGLSNIAMAGVLNELQRYLGSDLFEPELEMIARAISAEGDKDERKRKSN